MTSPDVPIRIPPLDPEWANLELAMTLVDAGLYVLPTRASDPKNAGSRLGAGWPGKTSRDKDTVVSWFAGSDDRVGIHCGRSGLVVPDVDHPEHLPDELIKAIAGEAPPYQSTRPNEPGRGHYLFRQPPGRRIGNRSGSLGKAWGEIRGTNGIILVGGPGREWLQTGDVPELPGYVADLLPDVADGEAAVCDADVHRFVAEHTMELAPSSLQAVLDGFEKTVEGGGSRHDAAVNHACWMVRDIISGRYSARKGFHRLERLFVEALAVQHATDDRTLPSGRAEAEFTSAVAWAIGQVWVSPGAVEGDQPVEDRAGQARAAWYETQVEAERERIEIREEARRRLDADRRPARAPIADRVVKWDDLASVPAPRMLIHRLMPDRAVGFINGRSGSFKSFVLVALAVSIGSGSPVMGHRDFRVAERGKVLYVAGEGSSGVALRLRAYAAAHNIPEAAVELHREAVNLSDTHEVAELYNYAADGGCTHVFVDTFRANAIGVKENDSTEVGVVIGGALRARDVHGIGTLYADHTGHSGERAVGAEAKWANVDYALMVGMPNGSRQADQQRTLRVEKLKDAETTGEWDLRLRAVESIRDADGNPSAVIEVGQVIASAALFGDNPEWWIDEVPPEIAGKFAGQGGRSAALAIVRALRRIDDEDGLTPSQLREVLGDQPGKTYSKTTFQAGLALVKRADVVTQGRTPDRLIIAPHWVLEPGSNGSS